MTAVTTVDRSDIEQLLRKHVMLMETVTRSPKAAFSAKDQDQDQDQDLVPSLAATRNTCRKGVQDRMSTVQLALVSRDLI